MYFYLGNKKAEEAHLLWTTRLASQDLVRNSLKALVGRLDDELIKSLKYMDHHTELYVKRLADDKAFLAICERVQNWYDADNDRETGTAICFRRIEHMYYTLDTDHATTLPQQQRVVSVVAPSSITAVLEPSKGDVSSLLQVLADRIYREGTERMKLRTMLSVIYHHAISDRFHVARDMLLMSGLHADLQADVLTQILYNRTVTQLGLCAFRSGLILEAHNCLQDICAVGRQKELLAQGTSARFNERPSPEQERLEKRRQVPFHQYINMEVLDACHMTSAMLLEVPNLAASATDHKRRTISKNYRKSLEHYDRQVSTGPPDNVRDSVIVAGKAMTAGEWSEAAKVLFALPCWSLMHPNPAECERIKTTITHHIKVETLRTYLFLHSPTYESIDLKTDRKSVV